MSALFIFSIPWILELAIEVYYEKVKKISINHFWSATVRGAVMLIISMVMVKTHNGLMTFSEWLLRMGEAIAFTVSLHWMFFDYLYNFLTGRKLTYYRKKGIDKFFNEQFGWLAVMFFRMITLLIGSMLYYKDLFR